MTNQPKTHLCAWCARHTDEQRRLFGSANPDQPWPCGDEDCRLFQKPPEDLPPEKAAKLAALMAEALPAIEERVKEVEAMGAISTPGLLDEIVGGAPEAAAGKHQKKVAPIPISDEDRAEFAQDAAHHPALSAPFSDPPPS